MGCEILRPFPKELTISFYLGKSVIQNKRQNQTKAAVFARFYSKIFEFGREQL